jgi:hypothetical protein
MQQGCSKMLEQLMNSKVQSDKKIDTNIKNNLQKEGGNQEVFAMLLSNQIMNQNRANDVSADKNSKLQSIKMDTKDKNQNVMLNQSKLNTHTDGKSFSKELISALDNKIDNLKNMKEQNRLVSESTKANMTMQSIFNELKTKKEFSELRSVEDLVKVANKNGLNIQNISIEKMEDALKSTNDKKISINDLINSKEIELTKEKIEKNKLESSKERLDTLKKVLDSNKKHDQDIIKETQKTLDKLSPYVGDTTQRVEKSESTNNKNYKYNSFQELTEQIEAKHEKKSISSLTELLNKHNDVEIKSTDKDNKNIPNIPTVNTKETKVETKNETKSDAKKDKEFSLNSLLKNSMKTESIEEGFSLGNLINKLSSNSDENSTKDSSTKDDPIAALYNDIKQESQVTTDRQDIKIDTLQKAESNSEFSSKVANAKETVKRFVTDLEQKLQDYKPPLMKIELELKPQHLGSVDVTVVSRGSSLSIQLSSNSQALQMFLQNQESFKNALSDIGFSDVKMDFTSSDGGSSNGGGFQGEGSNQQDSSSNQENRRVKEFDYYTENEELMTHKHIESIEITIPKYI